MKRIFRKLFLGLAAIVVLLVAGAAWYLHGKQPQRDGSVVLKGLSAAVTVRYDERGVPHISADNEADLYRALGYVHAQDRLFQMELMRRLARGELAEVLGAKLVEVDRLFRTLELRNHADAYVATMDRTTPAYRALDAYVDGINQYQDGHAAPLEFDLLGIPKRPFTPADSLTVAGYTAYSFAAALKTDPTLTYVRDQLGAQYLGIFDLDWHPEGVIKSAATSAPAPTAARRATPGATNLSEADWRSLGQLARVSQDAVEVTGVPAFEGSNSWVISGARTKSGKPLMAGDPHIAFSAPSVWYEAHLSSPGFELYGHFQGLTPFALLGHNREFAWSLTMFENDDMDLMAEKVNPDNPNQVWYRGQWVDMQQREETIAVKGAAPVKLTLRRSPHGPIVNGVLDGNTAPTPIALWWVFLETDNPILEAFYDLNRANTLAKARDAASKIHAPGLNVMWGSAAGDIAWWAAALLPVRPAGINPNFVLDGSDPTWDRIEFHKFSDNPHEENPSRGYVMTANQQPIPGSGVAVPGYYCLFDRAQELDDHLSAPGVKWDTQSSQALQLNVRNGYSRRFLTPLLPVLQAIVSDPGERALLEQLASWDGAHSLDGIAPTLFNQLLYEVAVAALSDEMAEPQFKTLLKIRALDFALPRLAADQESPWWDNVTTPARETRAETMKAAWQNTIAHLRKTMGAEPQGWTWGKAHTLTHNHPLGQQKPLDKLFSVGPMPAPGGREIPNFLGGAVGPAPWAVTMGPSTRRVVDLADAVQARGINPVGQSGILFDAHYSDQADDYIHGRSAPQHLSEADVAAHTRGTLRLTPGG